CHRWLFVLEECQHFLEWNIAVPNSDIELIKEHQPNFGIPDQLFRFFPSGAGMLDIALAILRLPGEPLTHRVDLAKVGKMLLDQFALARRHGALDELDHR